MYEQYCLCLFTECDAQPRTPRRINELSVSFLCRCVLVGVVPGVVCHAFYNIIKYAYFIFLPICHAAILFFLLHLLYYFLLVTLLYYISYKYSLKTLYGPKIRV